MATHVFTDEEIQQILDLINTTRHTQYIGSRYVPIFGRKGETSIEWDNSKPYEPLTIVLNEGNSYTSRQYVPAGIALTNNDYWASTGIYNAQIEQYRKDSQAGKHADDLLAYMAITDETRAGEHINAIEENHKNTQANTDALTALSADTVDNASALKIKIESNTTGVAANLNALTALKSETEEKATETRKIIDAVNNTYVSAESIGCVANDETVDNATFINAYFSVAKRSIVFGGGTYYFKTPIVFNNPSDIIFIRGSKINLNSDAIVDTAVTINGIERALSTMTLTRFVLECNDKANVGMHSIGIRLGNYDVYVYNPIQTGIHTEKGTGNRGILYVQGTPETYTNVGMILETYDDLWNIVTPVNCKLGVKWIGSGSTIRTFHPWRNTNNAGYPLTAMANYGLTNTIETAINDAIVRMFEYTDNPKARLTVIAYMQYNVEPNTVGINTLFYVPANAVNNAIKFVTIVASQMPKNIAIWENATDKLPVLKTSYIGNVGVYYNPLIDNTNQYPNGTYIIPYSKEMQTMFPQDKTGSTFYGGILTVESLSSGDNFVQKYTMKTAYWDAQTYIDGAAGTPSWRIIKYVNMG